MAEQLTRQQLYDRIRETSKDSFILEEMKRLGFWDNSPQPTLSEILIQKEVKLRGELNELFEKERRFNNRQAMLKEMRAAKLKAAKEKKNETKQKNEQKRLIKAQTWRETQEKNIVFLGEDVSKGLQQSADNQDLLNKYQLPQFLNITDLAQKMGLSLAQLRFLAYHRKVSKTSHYHHFYIPKKSGGQRLISAPKKNLKKVQKWILENILYKIQNQDVVHGFVPKHSIKTNALPHLQKEVVINIDLKDFFPSISYKRVKGLFQKLGYSEQIATIFTLLCTHFEVDKVNVDGVAYYVQKTERFLPQGSPASPAITNLIAHTLDLRLQGLAKKYDFTYTRYADDLTFSSNTINEKSIKTLMSFVQSIVNEEDFTIHPDKTHIMRRGSQKKVTGVVVNEKLNVDRAILHKFRALLHQIEKTGWEGKSWGNSSNLWMSMTGFVSYVMMVNPEKGNRLKEKMIQLAKKQEFNPKEKVSNPKKDNQNEIPSPNTPTPPSQPNEQGKKDWWDIFE